MRWRHGRRRRRQDLEAAAVEGDKVHVDFNARRAGRRRARRGLRAELTDKHELDDARERERPAEIDCQEAQLRIDVYLVFKSGNLD